MKENSENAIQKLCEIFDIGKLEKIEKPDEGVLNWNYKVFTDRGIYFAKNIRKKKYQNIDLIYSVEKFMQSSGIPAVVMLLNTEGKHYAEIESELFSLYSFIESDRSHSYIETDYFNMGEMLAKIHVASKNSIPENLTLESLRNPDAEEIVNSLKDYEHRISEKTEPDETDQKILKLIHLKLNLLSQIDKSEKISSHQSHVLHGDYHAGNLLIDQASREIIGICDWEKTERGSRAYEIARSASLLFWSIGEKEKPLFKSFLAGYNSVYSISEQELSDGFEFLSQRLAKSSWIEKSYYDNNDTRPLSLLDSNIERTEFYSKFTLQIFL